ncbi:rubrerythrin [Clostridium acetobutylicum]|nr:rubrerythrin [Clostridium acetobutylicum]
MYYNCPFNYTNDYDDYSYNDDYDYNDYNYNDLYRTENTPSTITNIYSYPQNLAGAIRLIEESVGGEREDELFYNYLLSVAPNAEAKRIITGIRDDERKHNVMLRRIYTQLTRRTLPQGQDETFQKPSSYIDGIRRSIIGETDAVKRYRTILFALQNRVHINMLTEILSDELRHASLYNMLLNLSPSR